MAPLLFVHIPKTGGSSFRMGIDKLLGARASFRDYGLKSPETSPEIRRLVYAESDTWQLRERIGSGKKKVIVGHFPVLKYLGLVGAPRVFTIVRDPVQRVVSEYGHFVRHYGFKGGILQFAQRAAFVNKQSNMLRGVPLEAIGLVGLTERYEETLGLFEKTFGFRPPYLCENAAREDLCAEYEISADQQAELSRLNAADLVLYRQAEAIFDRRMAAMNDGRASIRGRVTSMTNGSVKGWAVSDADDSPLIVEILIDGAVVGMATAVEFRPRAKGLGLGRGGFVGFSYELPKGKKKREVRCRVRGSDVFLPGAGD